MSATVLVQGDVATLTNTFLVEGVETDPTAVSLIVRQPDGTETTYTYADEITKTSTGVYTLDVTCASAGQWTARWIGTVAAADVATVSWTIWPVAEHKLYASVDDVKSRLGIGDTADDFEIVGAIHAASRAIDRYCRGRGHFYRDGSATARRISPRDWATDLPVLDIATTDDLVVKVGTIGSFDTTLTLDVDFVTLPYDALADGRPITALRRAGCWPMGSFATVEVTAEWGWPSVPSEVREACLIKAVRLFRRKDAPGGIAGVSEFGVVTISRYEDGDVQLLLADLQKVMVA